MQPAPPTAATSAPKLSSPLSQRKPPACRRPRARVTADAPARCPPAEWTARCHWRSGLWRLPLRTRRKQERAAALQLEGGARGRQALLCALPYGYTMLYYLPSAPRGPANGNQQVRCAVLHPLCATSGAGTGSRVRSSPPRRPFASGLLLLLAACLPPRTAAANACRIAGTFRCRAEFVQMPREARASCYRGTRCLCLCCSAPHHHHQLLARSLTSSAGGGRSSKRSRRLIARARPPAPLRSTKSRRSGPSQSAPTPTPPLESQQFQKPETRGCLVHACIKPHALSLYRGAGQCGASHATLAAGGLRGCLSARRSEKLPWLITCIAPRLESRSDH